VANFVKVKAIKRLGVEPVYNLEVENHRNFTVNGGYVVHNCIDAARYMLSEDMKTNKGVSL